MDTTQPWWRSTRDFFALRLPDIFCTQVPRWPIWIRNIACSEPDFILSQCAWNFASSPRKIWAPDTRIVRLWFGNALSNSTMKSEFRYSASASPMGPAQLKVEAPGVVMYRLPVFLVPTFLKVFSVVAVSVTVHTYVIRQGHAQALYIIG